MKNNNSQLFLLLDDFKNEDEVSNFFEKNMSAIFKNLVHIKTKWRIPCCDLEDNKRTIDALAFYNKKGERERLVLLEYKHNDPKNPISQLLGYFNILRDNKGNLVSLEKRYNKFLTENGRKKEFVEWEDFNSNQKKNFWKNRILIAVAPFFDKNRKQEAKREEEKIILIKVKKYVSKYNKKDEFVSISLVENSYKELLGMSSESIIIQIPKKEKQLENNQETLIHIPERVGESKEKENNEPSLERFLAGKEIDKKEKDKMLKIDELIRQIFGKEKKIKLTHGYLVYYDNIDKKQAKGQILGIKLTKKECSIWLEDNQTTKAFVSKPYTSNSPAKNLTRLTNIKNDEEYNKIMEILEEYLSQFKEQI
ncbi:hypothetical protein [endosymbiont GvMRE of Glomus versiforme]|uniref:hypothetical protein n=1 Tax=endosymbiont GvMRE of Glomus versiforme TaxID=2039283 RepID=UPI0011C40983|nr:hypothetical protein [endosymbiont GvMRE of Glomus versiforme]